MIYILLLNIFIMQRTQITLQIELNFPKEKINHRRAICHRTVSFWRFEGFSAFIEVEMIFIINIMTQHMKANSAEAPNPVEAKP